MLDVSKAKLAEVLAKSGDDVVAAVEEIVASEVAAALASQSPSPGTGISPEQEALDIADAVAKTKASVTSAVDAVVADEAKAIDAAIAGA